MSANPLPKPVKSFHAGKLPVEVYATNEELGIAAAARVAPLIVDAIRRNGECRIILATGNSQFSFAKALVTHRDIDWSKVVCFHMDEYVGISATHSASFRLWMKQRIESILHPKAFHYVEGDNPDTEAEVERYSRLLTERPIDITCLGIGENGHLAFNDPPVADFNDPQVVKVVELEESCKLQQVGEGHFPDIASVPTHAITLTIPTLLSAGHVFAMVPEARKATAVYNTVHAEISTAVPSTILRTQPHALLYLDADSAARL
jgi:glucosamine-6-phosphate deaminase